MVLQEHEMFILSLQKSMKKLDGILRVGQRDGQEICF